MRLAARLHGDAALRSALERALEDPCPSIETLVAAGVPHYRARELCQALVGAGEVTALGWQAEVRAGYQRLLTDPPATAGRLHQLAAGERPREKARWQGIGALADAELLAVLLRTGRAGEGVLELAERLLRDHDGLLGLADQDVQELARSHGLGPAKATEIAAAFELGRRLALAVRKTRPSLRGPQEVVALLAGELAPRDHEQFWLLPLDTRSRLIGEPQMVSKGDVDGTEAGARLVFRVALRANASSVIVAHNHPTGICEASAADLAVTRALRQAGRVVGIPLADHIIIGDGGRYYSIRHGHPELWRES